MNDAQTNNWQKIDIGFKALLLLIATGFVLADLFVIFSRLFYPYQLEWMEGASLVQVQRLMTGQTLYAPPSIHYVPLIYPPLFFYVARGIAAFVGFGFGALRLVSFLSSAVCALCIYFAVAEKTNSRFAGWLGAGCFASAFLLTNQWFDIARTDMLATALSVLAVYVGREKEDPKNLRILLSGVLFALALLTKQAALLMAVAAVIYYVIFHWQRAALLVLSFGISFATLYVVFWLHSAGWITYYLFTLPSAHVFDFQPGHILSILISQFTPIPIFLLVAFLPVAVAPRQIFDDKLYRYYYVMSVALMITSVIGRTNAYSGRNVYIPAYVGVAFLMGLEAGWLIERMHRSETHYAWIILEWILVSTQFASLAPAYLHTKMIPSAQDRSAGNRLVAKIRSYKGDVILLKNNYLALYAGKTPYYNEMPMSELSGQGNLYPMAIWSALQARIKLLFHAPTTSAIFVNSLRSIERFTADCRHQSIPYPDKIVFTPVAGPPNSRPNLILTCR